VLFVSFVVKNSSLKKSDFELLEYRAAGGVLANGVKIGMRPVVWQVSDRACLSIKANNIGLEFV
jgi:hypothetical protein